MSTIYCPSCGTPNEAKGARVTCVACAVTFEVSQGLSPGKPSGDVPPALTPDKPEVRPAVLSAVASPGARQAPVRPLAQGASGASTNPLAITSLVFGVLCCIPLVSPAVALGCGIAALKQINAATPEQPGKPLAIAGIVLGGIQLVLNLLGLIGALAAPHPH
ncbi:MAG: DUF4190 domain-containing protein [Myxococcaceae bacterium]|nr:DUF4190 domain-containing protein [Myxococcaceae bacterium]